jgi:hypothetical protein
MFYNVNEDNQCNLHLNSVTKEEELKIWKKNMGGHWPNG